jgi:hypothetical protein
VRGLPEVWRKGGKPWIEPDAGAVQRIVEVVHRCPSGALSATVAGVEATAAARPAVIAITQNGPYAVTGGPLLRDASGIEPPVRERYTLCRCGHSKNKPFCDGTHTTIGFVDERT